jgi:acyl transferase domain-containing protein
MQAARSGSGRNIHAGSEGLPAAPAASAVIGKNRTAFALLLSADSPGALRDLARLWAGRLARPDTRLEDAAYTVALQRRHLLHRFAFAAASSDEAIATLDAFARSGSAPPGALGVGCRSSSKLAFVFSGQGSQWIGMGRTLLGEPAFRTGLEGCDVVVKRIAGFSVVDELLRQDERSRLRNSCVGAIAVFSVQVALACLWKAVGVVPDVVIGQSLGEVAAAHVAGALTLEDAALVAVHRSLLMQRLAGTGRAAVIGLPFEQVAGLLGGHAVDLHVAGIMSPGSTVVAGDSDAVAALVAAMGRRGIFARMSRIDVAVHTPHVAPLVPDLVAAIRSIRPRPSIIPFASCAKGGLVDGAALDAEFWGEHLRRPFFLSRTVSAAIDAGAALFLEISPHPSIGLAIAETLSAMSRDAPVLASMRRDVDEARHFLDSVACLYAAGRDVALELLFAGANGGDEIRLPS